MWSAPDRAQLEHYGRDPRGRRLLVVEEAGGIAAAAIVVLAEVIEKGGDVDRVTTLDAVWLPDPTTERLSGLCRGAAAVFADRASTPVVSAPNLAALPADVIRAAGLRPTG